MKFVWSSILCLLIIDAAVAFKDLFRLHHPATGKPDLLDVFSKPKIPGLNLQIGSHFGASSFGFGFNFGGQFLPSSVGVNLPPKEIVNEKPDDFEASWEQKKKEKVGPRPNWGKDKDNYPKPESPDNDREDYPKPGVYDDEKEDYSMPGSFEGNGEDSKPGIKDSLPDWEDIGEKHPKSDSLMDGDLVGDGLIQPRLNKRRSKRLIESRVFHVPLVFRSNAKPYQVKIRNDLNSLMTGDSEA